MLLGRDALRGGGAFVLVGTTRGSLPFELHGIPAGARFHTVINGGTRHLRALVELVKLRRITLFVDRYKLAQVEEAYADMDAGRLKGRAVCVM